MKIEGKFIFKVAGTLTAISLVVALLLGLTNMLTADKIAAINKQKTEEALAKVVSAADCEFPPMEEIPQAMIDAANEQGGKLSEVYEVQSGGDTIGYAFKVTASGSQGNIVMIVGNFFAIFVVKQLYGGLGKNFLNPALAGRAALVACYTGQMTSWIDPSTKAPLFGGADVVTAATPLAMMKGGEFAEVTAQYSLSDMFIGNIGGSLGEISAMMLLIGGLYLIFRKVISWQIPVAYIGTVAVLTFLFPQGNDAMSWMLYNVLGGGLFLGAFFMATDYVTSPVTKKGQLIFGIGCGLITVFIRYFGSYPEGVCYSILIMNCTTWLLDKYVRPTIYGAPKKEKKEAAAK